MSNKDYNLMALLIKAFLLPNSFSKLRFTNRFNRIVFKYSNRNTYPSVTAHHIGRDRPQRVGPVIAHRPQAVPRAARLDGAQGRQNLRHRTRLEAQLVASSSWCPFRLRHIQRRRLTVWHQWIQLAVTLEISVLFHRAESSQGTTVENFKVQRRINIDESRARATPQPRLWRVVIRVCVCECECVLLVWE